jgi:hypothetical protein
MEVFPADEVVVGDKGGGPTEGGVLPADKVVVAETIMFDDVVMLTIPGNDYAATITMSDDEAIMEAEVMTVVTMPHDDVEPGTEDMNNNSTVGMAIMTVSGNDDAATVTISFDEAITEAQVVA